MTHYVGLDVSQKLTAICIVDDTGRRVWRGQCTSDPEQIERAVRRHAEEDARIGSAVCHGHSDGGSHTSTSGAFFRGCPRRITARRAG